MTGFILLSLLVAAYWLPTIVAAARNHRQLVPIAVLTGFAGWTFVGWVSALVWSVQSSQKGN